MGSDLKRFFYAAELLSIIIPGAFIFIRQRLKAMLKQSPVSVNQSSYYCRSSQ